MATYKNFRTSFLNSSRWKVIARENSRRYLRISRGSLRWLKEENKLKKGENH